MPRRVRKNAMPKLKDFVKQMTDKLNQLIQGLGPVVKQLNMQNLSQIDSSNVGSNTKGTDEIGSLVQQISDNAAIDRIVSGLSSSTPFAPKTNAVVPQPNGTETLGPTVPAPKDSKTTVVPTATKEQLSQMLKPFTSDITKDTIAQYTQKYNVPDAKVTEAILKAAKDTGTDADLLFSFARQESKFDPRAKAPSSSASGLFQFINSTWNDVLTRLGGKANFNLKGNKFDPYESAVGASIYLNEIKKNIGGAIKRPLTVGDYYAGHFAGPAIAKTAFEMVGSGKGNLPANKVFGSDQISGNKPIFYTKDGKMRSVQEVLQHLSNLVS